MPGVQRGGRLLVRYQWLGLWLAACGPCTILAGLTWGMLPRRLSAVSSFFILWCFGWPQCVLACVYYVARKRRNGMPFFPVLFTIAYVPRCLSLREQRDVEYLFEQNMDNTPRLCEFVYKCYRQHLASAC